MRNCDTEIETAKHVFLPLPFPCLERHNPHDNLCLLDPPVISFDEEYVMKTSPFYT